MGAASQTAAPEEAKRGSPNVETNLKDLGLNAWWCEFPNTNIFYSAYIAWSTMVTSCQLCVCAEADSGEERRGGKDDEAVSKEEDAWAAEQDFNQTSGEEKI